MCLRAIAKCIKESIDPGHWQISPRKDRLKDKQHYEKQYDGSGYLVSYHRVDMTSRLVFFCYLSGNRLVDNILYPSVSVYEFCLPLGRVTCSIISRLPLQFGV